ncbi:MAG: hypothetical protein ACI8X5_003319, partial [Planctomycetota bacterium]
SALEQKFAKPYGVGSHPLDTWEMIDAAVDAAFFRAWRAAS